MMERSAALISCRTWQLLLRSGLLLFCFVVTDGARTPRQAGPAGGLGLQGVEGLGQWFTEKVQKTRNVIRQYRNVPTVIEELYGAPPKPLQVFEYGPSRRTFLQDPDKYKYQYVCVVSRLGDFEQAAWHRRKAPTNWVDEPPFHMRIVRPTPAGILHYMLTTGKAELQKVDLSITATDNETGEKHDVNRKITVIVRTDKDRPKKKVSREKMGTKGKWGPPLPPEGMRERTALEEMLCRTGLDLDELWGIAKADLKKHGEDIAD